ncbi:cupin domain-containing protein [Govanella unica]|uniref:Cupin domain-containing protein n=1 Tax=Govanella unica TaxID=2975056 RepID=A0A9X3TZ61_9PROT|nr:cupin domain-containing protein [Govania unica]MDA5194661.1 cupin domain-containing protein [Govania unica]
MVYKRNIITTEWTKREHDATYRSQRKSLTPKGVGFTPKLGLSLYRLAPGKRAFPAHYHTANDEAILILDGSGSLRWGDNSIPLAQGDYIHLAAASGIAHQVINDSDSPLNYLCFSTMIEPEITIYPESDKIGITAGCAPGGDPNHMTHAAFLKNNPVDYWDGEA